MTKTPMIPLMIHPTCAQALAELKRYSYSGARSGRTSRLTGTPKTLSEQCAVVGRNKTAAEIVELKRQAYARLWGASANKMASDAVDAILHGMSVTMDNGEEERNYRKFAEAFVLARAGGFKDQQDIHAAVLDAKTVYKMIKVAAEEYRPKPGPGVGRSETARLPDASKAQYNLWKRSRT